MAIPDYQTWMLPLLEYASDGQEHSIGETIEALADHFQLTDAERKELMSSGQATFYNRAQWAKTYLVKAGLLASPRRAHIIVTDRGREALAEKPDRIDVAFLRRYPEFVEFQQRRKKKDVGPTPPNGGEAETPEELLDETFQELQRDLASDLLERLKACPPSFFERIVVDVLVKMGYGGSRKDAGQAVGRSGDEGIDGIIKEDKLGLDVVYIQAKRWENSVGRPEIQRFVGALQGRRARKGVFITTATFSSGAIEYSRNVETNVVLIDGEQLVQFMIDHNVGVSTEAVYEVKKADSDYFTT